MAKSNEIGTMVMIETGITSKGQTTIPKPVREALGGKPGDRVRYAILDGKVFIMPVKPLSRFYGNLKYDGPPVSLTDMDRGTAEVAVESAMES